MATDAPEQIHDLTPADMIEERARRLMAERAALGPDTWQTRQDRAALLDLIDEELLAWVEVAPE